MSTSHLPTHDVINQATAFEGQNVLSVDVALSDSIARADAPWLSTRAHQLGELVGTPTMQAWGRLANTHAPTLKTFDRFGHRLDVVEFHPAYHELMGAAMAHEIPSAAWTHERAGHLGFVTLSYLFTQAEAGVICPMTMTYAAAPTLRLEPGLDSMWLEKLCHRTYDARFIPASQKHALTFGMAMTEKQGGSDVRANTTTATPCGGAGRANAYLLRGHKWFCSAPMSDAFLTLAHAKGGLSCFLVPRFRPDGTQNNLYIQRLKDKLGNRSNASAEIEYLDTWAQLVGEEGEGVRTIIEMVRHTRLACIAGSSGLMRHALTCAVHHARHRRAFGKVLYHQPLMRQVLADLTLESEAALHLVTRMATAFDAQEHNEHERALARIGVTLAKYWICKRTPRMTYEAMECLGGAGYVEESPMPRIFRESPLNSIWEGSGNVMALDILRAMHKEPECVHALRHEFAQHAGRHNVLDELCSSIDKELSNTQDLERRARRVAEQLALALQACAVAKQAPDFVFEAFMDARLGPDRAHTFGALPSSCDVDALLGRSLPK